MRSDNANFAAFNQAASKETYVTVQVAFDAAGTDLAFFTSSSSAQHPVGATVYDGVVISAPQISQKLNPDKALSTIGSQTVVLLDNLGAISQLFKDKLDGGDGTRGKTMVVYVGGPGLAWADYEAVSTQVWDTDDSKDHSLRIQCADIQRELRTKVFEPATSILQAVIDASASSIQILAADVDNFVAVEHDFSYTDAPAIQTAASISASGATATVTRTSGTWDGSFDYLGAGQTIRFASWSTGDNNVECTVTSISGADMVVTRSSGTWTTEGSTTIELFPHVGYVRIKTGDAIEYIRWLAKGSDTLDECARGVLLSKAAGHGSASGSKTEVVEVNYLEGPAVKIAYAVLTGELHGQQGATIPTGWHCGVSSSFVSLTEFENIGADIWDGSEGDAAPLGAQRISKYLRFVNEQDQDGKKFIEEQILLPFGLFMPVRATGALGLQRMTGVLSGSGYVAELNSRNVIDYGTLKSDKRAVINNMAIRWGWDSITETFQRTTRLLDSDSITKHGRAPAKVLEFRGITDTIQTEALLYDQFDALRNRYAGPPWRISVTVAPPLNVLEVGDVVRLKLDQVKDYAGNVTSIDRAFEIQQVKADWVDGDVTLDLFGSTETASIIEKPSKVLDSVSDPIPSSFITSEGTELKTALGAGEYTEAGGTLTITGGADNIATLTGHVTNITNSAAIFYYDGNITVANTCTLKVVNNVQIRYTGLLSFDGSLDAQLGGTVASSLFGVGKTGAAGGLIGRLGSTAGAVVEAPNTGVQGVNVVWDGSTLTLPFKDLRGIGGAAGGGATGSVSDPLSGGAGGLGAAGLLTVGGGLSVSGANSINFSGSDGSLGDSATAGAGRTLYAGSGGGGFPGCWIAVINGSSKTHPGIGGLKAAVTANLGDCPFPHSPASEVFLVQRYTNNATLQGQGFLHFYASETGFTTRSMVDDAVALVVLQDIPAQGSEESNRVYADDVTTLTLTESTNTPKSAAGNLSTIEADITAPADTNWKEAVIEYRVNGSSAPFLEIGRTTTSLTVVVASDGIAYEFRARSVSRKDVAAPDGVSATITVTDIDAASSGTPVPETVLPVPNVYGLEIFQQGNDDEFVGRDCKVAWRKTSTTEWVELGAEVAGQGAGQGTLDLYFQDYRVQIYDDSGNLLREEFITDSWYLYTYEKNVEDYIRINGLPSDPEVVPAYRFFWFRVAIRSRQNQFSPRDAVLRVSNPLPGLLRSVSLDPTFNGVLFSSRTSGDHDLAEIRIWASTSSGFTPSAATLVYSGPYADKIGITNQTPDTTYYLVYSPVDTFGKDDSNLSSELTYTTDSALLTAATTGVFAGTVPIGGVFAATGSQAWGNYNPGDTVTIPDTTYRLEMGPVVDGSDTYIIRWHQPSSGTQPLTMLDDGSFSFGDVSAETFVTFDVAASEFLIGRSVNLRGGDSYANADHYYHDQFMTLDPYAITDTSGVISLGADALTLTLPDSTANTSTLTITRSIPGVQGSWSKNRRARFAYQQGVSDNGGTTYIGFGGNDPTAKRWAGAKLTCSYGTPTVLQVAAYAHNATSATESLATTYSTGGLDPVFEVVYVPATSLTVYVDGTQIAQITSGLPTDPGGGPVDADKPLSVYTSTTAAGLGLTMVNKLFDYRYVQEET